MKVSIIVPTYNRPALLKRALESIERQSFNDYEVVVINDGGCSIDGIIKESNIKEKINYVNKQFNSGLSISLNIALNHAKGDFIAYLDDDDIYYPHHLETLYSELESGYYLFAYSRFIKTVIDENNEKVLSKTIIKKESYSQETLFHHNLMATNCVMHSRKCLEKAGRFKEDLDVLMDWQLWLRMSQHFNFCAVDNITCEVFQYNDDSNMSSNKNLMDATYYKIRNQIIAGIYKKRSNFHEAVLEEQLRKHDDYKRSEKEVLTHFQKIKAMGIENVAIFGASHSGDYYKTMLEQVGIYISKILDNDEEKHGSDVCGLNYLSSDAAKNLDAVIIASRSHKEEIYYQLKGHVEGTNIKILKR